MARVLRGIKGKDAIKAFIRAGVKKRPGKGDHINIKMPNGIIITILDTRKRRVKNWFIENRYK